MKRTLLASLLFVTAASLQGACAQDAPIQITDAWSRATPGHADTGVVYLTLIDHGAADQLIGLETPVADRAEMHESGTQDGIMSMRAIDQLPITAGQTRRFAPGGDHIMLIGLHQPLRPGMPFPITLRFAHAAPVTVPVAVRALGAAAPTTMPGMDMPDDHPR